MTRITDYTALAEPAAGDELVIVDVSDTSMSAAGTTKKITVASLLTVINAVHYGADPTGSADSTTAIQAALNAVTAPGGTVYLPAGTYKVTSTLTNAVTPTYIRGAGRWATTIDYHGTGDCIRMLNSAGSGSGLWSGGVLDLYITGTNSTAPATALHIGDGEQYELNVAVQNWTGGGSIGVHFDNTLWWTEKTHGTIFARNCDTHIVFDVSGASTSQNSYGYLDLTCYLYVQVGQDGVVVQNGAYLYHGRLVIKGNVQNQTASPASNAALRVTGQMPAGHPNSNFSQIARCQVDMQMEVPANSSGNTFQPYGVNFGTGGSNGILGCYGIIDLTQGGGEFQACNINIPGQAGSLSFQGPVVGDLNLNPAGQIAQPANIGTTIYGSSFMSGANGNAFIQWGDFFACLLSASITVDLSPSSQATVAAPQRKTFKITQAAAGGPFTVTWPKPGSPSVTNPAVYWPGGVTPTMSAGASAVDIYNLVTFDGIRWYGEALQAMS